MYLMASGADPFNCSTESREKDPEKVMWRALHHDEGVSWVAYPVDIGIAPGQICVEHDAEPDSDKGKDHRQQKHDDNAGNAAGKRYPFIVVFESCTWGSRE